MQTSDTRQSKSAVDLRAVADHLLGPGQHSRRCVMYHCLWHTENTPSLAIYPDGYKCFGCGVSGDAFNLVMKAKNVEFQAAKVWLVSFEGRVGPVPAMSGLQESQGTKSQEQSWNSKSWQDAVRQVLEEARDRLWKRKGGEPGRQYLQGRGIGEDAWLAFGLGYGLAWHPKRRRELPAIFIPWQNRKVTALEYRFIGEDIGKFERFSQKRGGDRLLFGLHLRGAQPADTLMLCEGELNAISLWQVCSGVHPVDVLSWGSQDNIRRPLVVEVVRRLAGRCRRVIVWADEARYAIAAFHAVGGAELYQSPRGLDANDLLQAGLLEAYVMELLAQPVFTRE